MALTYRSPFAIARSRDGLRAVAGISNAAAQARTAGWEVAVPVLGSCGPAASAPPCPLCCPLPRRCRHGGAWLTPVLPLADRCGPGASSGRDAGVGGKRQGWVRHGPGWVQSWAGGSACIGTRSQVSPLQALNCT